MEKSTGWSVTVGAGVTILCYLVKVMSDQEVPGEIAAAVTTFIMGLVTHFVPDTPKA